MDSESLTILDGGMGKHLENSGAPFRQPEWSALALIEEPTAVRQAHTDFIEAGADVIIANTYAVVPFHLGADVFSRRGAELGALAGSLAREAADAAGRPIRVAGSLPPLFGSYEPQKFRPAEAPALLDVLIEAQAPFVDLWIAETVSSIAEAVAVIEAVDRHGEVPQEIWMSFTVPDDPPGDEVRLRSGESIDNAVDAVAERVSAILFNCSPPEAITVALGHAATALSLSPHDVPLGAYANAFVPKPEVYSANAALLGRRPDLTPQGYRSICSDWIGRGATIIGGCCHMFPEHIEALATLQR